MQQDYYQILGVSRDATITEIKKAYKKLVFKYHPDRNRDNLEEVEAVMKEVNIAYEVLSDENKRAEYDRNFYSTSSNYSSSNFGDLSFKISSRTINYNQDMKLFASIKKGFNELALKNGSEFHKIYVSCGNLDKFHECGYDLGVILILTDLNVAVKMCTEVGRYDINVERFLKLDTENMISKPWTEAFIAIDEQYIEIQSMVLSEEERRELRKNSRAKMVGAGFGLKNAVIASMEAGAVNLATGALHTIFNSIGNAFTRASANNKKKAIYNNEEVFMFLKNGLEDSVHGIGLVLAYKVFNLHPFEKDINSALAIIDNLKNNRIPKNRVVNAILDALEIYPFDPFLYDKGKQYLHGADLKVLNDMAEFFGINAQRKSYIEQYLSFAETYKENNNMGAALKWYERAANLNSLKALRFLGKYYLEEQNNETLVVNYLEKAADLGDIESLYELGEYYYNEDEDRKAVYYFRQVIGKANKDTHYYNEASSYLGTCYFNGWGTEKDYTKAFDIFSRLIHQNHKGIAYYLGQCYFKGLGTEKNYAEAVKLLKIADNEGNVQAAYYLGCCYYDGYGVNQDYVEAIKYFTKSAKANDKDSWYMLAICYEKGTGVNQNLENAFKFYYKAASLGQNDATFAVGRCYENAIGTEKNIIEAIKYYEIAGKAGNNSALKQLKLLTEQKSVQKEVNKYNKAVEKEIRAEEKAVKREEQKNSIKEGCSTGCGCLIWIIIIYFVYKWLFD